MNIEIQISPHLTQLEQMAAQFGMSVSDDELIDAVNPTVFELTRNLN